ncbi:hypothetical protein Vadar_010195 [Vaccinium darrowii]|uniref:Uncharacterized protein n=1 Tax=Vaccinium darrowii TaxID=229202 RepID=A0ACB7XYV6_9ERIC|nr:hypothetical protein Vadar_010195 [Vaccinium darrowii]
MVLIRFASLVLGLLYLLHALRDSSVYAQGSGMHGNKLMEVDDVSAASARKMMLKGRKMLADEAPRREVEKEEDQLNGGTSKISGKDPNASKRTAKSQDHFNNKINNSPMLKPNTKKESVHFPSTKPHDYYHLPDSRAVSTKSTTSKYESEGLFDDRAISEIANLMRKDYTDTHRSPPINNQEPND